MERKSYLSWTVDLLASVMVSQWWQAHCIIGLCGKYRRHGRYMIDRGKIMVGLLISGCMTRNRMDLFFVFSVLGVDIFFFVVLPVP